MSSPSLLSVSVGINLAHSWPAPPLPPILPDSQNPDLHKRLSIAIVKAKQKIVRDPQMWSGGDPTNNSNGYFCFQNCVLKSYS